MTTGLIAMLLAAILMSAYLFVANMPDVGIYLASREADALHLIMNATMVTMLVYPGIHAGMTAIVLLYGLMALYLVYRLVVIGRSTTSADRPIRIASEVYHLMVVMAMLYALRGMGGMGTGMGDMSASPHLSAGRLLLITIFLVDACATLCVAMFAPRAMAVMVKADQSAAWVTYVRLSAFPHVAMDIAMAQMLAG